MPTEGWGMLENLPPKVKATVVVNAIDIAGCTMMSNRERLATLVQSRHSKMDKVVAMKAVDFAIEVLAMLADDAEGNVG
jgi:hypothetical protein